MLLLRMRPNLASSFEGAILGLAVGDALGFPAEFRRREAILRGFGASGLDDFVARRSSLPPPSR